MAGTKLAFLDITLKDQIMDPVSLLFAVYLCVVQAVKSSSHSNLPRYFKSASPEEIASAGIYNWLWILPYGTHISIGAV